MKWLLLCASSFFSLGSYKIGNIDCVPRDTLPVVLYSLGQSIDSIVPGVIATIYGQGFRPRGSPRLSHLLEELFTHGQLQDVIPGRGQGFKRHPQAQIPLVRSVVASYMFTQFCFRWFINLFLTFL